MDVDGGAPGESNAELVGRFYDLWNDDSLEAATELFTEDAGSATPRGGSLDLEMGVVPVFGIRDGRIAHISWYESVARAIEAVERLEPAAGS